MAGIQAELAETRDLLARLTSGRLSLRRNRVDVSSSEIAVLKREIAFLEKILGRGAG
jgi:hypothetical protein